MRRGKRAAITVFIAIILLLPFVGIAALTLWDRENSLQPPTIETVPVRSASSDSSDPVDIALIWSAIPPVFAPSWSGTVTALPEPASSWKSGDRVVQVDGVWRIAFASEAPFTRPLGIGDTGSDVASLGALLSSLNLPSESTDELGWTTLRSVQALAAQLGVTDTVYSFDPSWVIFLPRATIDASQSVLQLGGPAPSQGAPIVPAGKELSGATLVATGQFGSLASNTAPPTTTPTVDPSLLVAVTTTAASRLMFGDKQLGVESDGTHLDAEGLRVISGTAAPGAAYVDAQLITAAQPGAFLIPAASIVVDASGASCVFTNKADKPPVAVTIVTNRDDSVEVVGQLSATYRLLVDVPAVKRSCG